MYAVIEAGGVQHVVKQGDKIRLNKHEAEAGATVTFEHVLMVSDDKGACRIGAPMVDGASVTAKVLAQGKSPKVTVYKYRRRKNYRRNVGHRQPFTELEIAEIKG